MATMLTGASYGTSGASGAILGDRKVVDMADKIFLLEPDAAPLYVLVSRLRKRAAHNTTINWIEDELNPTWLNAAATATSAATALTFTSSGRHFNTYDLIKNANSGELMLVTATAANTITVTRGYGTTGASAIATSDDILIMGSAFREGSVNTDLITKSTQTELKTNYMQIFRKSVELSQTLNAMDLYGGPDRAYQRKKKGIELMQNFERHFLYSEPYQDQGTKVTDEASARRIMGGIDYFISTNETAAGGTLTESEFESWLRSFFRYGSNSRVVFASPLIMSVISLWAVGRLQNVSKDKTEKSIGLVKGGLNGEYLMWASA